LYYNITGTSNTGCGYTAGPANGYSNLTNSTALGNLATNTASNQVRIGNTAVTSIGGYTGWSNLSDERFKKSIQENVPGLEFIDKLRPVTYQLDVIKLDQFLGYSEKDPDYQSSGDKADDVYTGFVAQEVEEAAQSIGFDFSGIDPAQNDNDHYSLRYAEFVVPMVKAIQEQQQMINNLIDENSELKQRLERLENN